MKHFVTDSEPIHDKQRLSVCGKLVTVLRRIETDADFQGMEMNSLTECRKCHAGKIERYLYLGEKA